MKDNNIDYEDKLIRKAMQATKRKASDNLKHRVMHQIMQEQALSRNRKSSPIDKPTNVIREFLGIFGVMYAVLALLVIGIYFIKGKEFLLSTQFMYPAIFVCFVFAMFWLISAFDMRRKRR